MDMDGSRYVNGCPAAGQTAETRDAMEVILYGTEFCSLCDEARALAAPVCRRLRRPLREVDVADDARLEEQYAERVPVLVRTDTGRELQWPFENEDLYRFLV